MKEEIVLHVCEGGLLVPQCLTGLSQVPCFGKHACKIHY